MKRFLFYISFYLPFFLQANSAFSQAAPSFDWAKRAGGQSVDEGNDVKFDSNGNVYVVGSFFDPITFGTTTLQSSGATDIFLVKYDPAGNVLWARKAGGSNSDNGYGLTVDAAGNCFITGNFRGTATFGTTTLTAFGTTGGADVFVAKYDTNGNSVWAVRFGGSEFDSGSAITTDASGNIYVTGSFLGFSIIGSNGFSNSTGYEDTFFTKLDSTGNVIWAKRNGGPQSQVDLISDIALDGSGNIYLTGFFSGTSTFGTISLVSNTPADRDMYNAKYDPTGNIIWAKKGGSSPGTDRGNGIIVDSNGNSYVTGQFQGQATFGSTTLTSGGIADIFLAKYDASGNEVWVKQAGSAGEDGANDIDIDGSGNLYITGGFSGTASFGNLNIISSGSLDIYVAKYDQSGNPIWAKQAGGSGTLDVGYAIAVDNSGNSVITGRFNPEIYFDAIGFSSTAPGFSDMYVAKLNSTPVPCVIPGVTISAACSGSNQVILSTLLARRHTASFTTVTPLPR